MAKGKPEVRSALFGGKGDVIVTDLLGETRLAPFTAVLDCELAPGGNVGAHVQTHFPEIVVVTAGAGAITAAGERHEVTAGSLVALPLGATLAIENGSEREPLRYLIIKARG